MGVERGLPVSKVNMRTSALLNSTTEVVKYGLVVVLPARPDLTLVEKPGDGTRLSKSTFTLPCTPSERAAGRVPPGRLMRDMTGMCHSKTGPAGVCDGVPEAFTVGNFKESGGIKSPFLL